MAKSVPLDKSGWDAAALERGARLDREQAEFRARQAAVAGHVLANVWDEATDATREASQEPRYCIKATDFGNGHREVCVWREVPNPERTLERAVERDLGVSAARGEGDREASIAAATRRARQRVRHLCKAMIVNSIWTLTYRVNVTDRDLVLKHLDRFRRRVVAVLGEWRYIAVLEKQQRGAWHIHIATHALPVRLVQGGVKVKSWDVMRAIWRSVVGELGGTFNEAKRKARNGQHSKAIKGAGAIASYIAGYVAKDMAETGLNRRRYSHSEGVEVPDSYRAMWGAESVPFWELLELSFAFLGDRVTRRWFSPESGVFFAESDDGAPVG